MSECICPGGKDAPYRYTDCPEHGTGVARTVVHKREDFAAAEALSDNGELALKGMVAKVFGAALSDFADDMAACAEVALRELAKENLPRLNARILELMEQRRR